MDKKAKKIYVPPTVEIAHVVLEEDISSQLHWIIPCKAF